MTGIGFHKSFKFALHIIELYKYLAYEKREYVISKQILRSGTSIGANIKESRHGESKKDFLHKINIALKEAGETEYWLQLLYESDYIDSKTSDFLLNECRELIKILVSTIKTTKNTLTT